MTTPLRYTNEGRRLAYHPDYHPNHGKPWTVRDLAYLCYHYGKVKGGDLALELGRTHATVAQTKLMLVREGRYDGLKKMYEERFM